MPLHSRQGKGLFDDPSAEPLRDRRRVRCGDDVRELVAELLDFAATVRMSMPLVRDRWLRRDATHFGICRRTVVFSPVAQLKEKCSGTVS